MAPSLAGGKGREPEKCGRRSAPLFPELLIAATLNRMAEHGQTFLVASSLAGGLTGAFAAPLLEQAIHGIVFEAPLLVADGFLTGTLLGLGLWKLRCRPVACAIAGAVLLAAMQWCLAGYGPMGVFKSACFGGAIGAAVGLVQWAERYRCQQRESSLLKPLATGQGSRR
jgi:hypothetical protein